MQHDELLPEVPENEYQQVVLGVKNVRNLPPAYRLSW